MLVVVGVIGSVVAGRGCGCWLLGFDRGVVVLSWGVSVLLLLRGDWVGFVVSRLGGWRC